MWVHSAQLAAALEADVRTDGCRVTILDQDGRVYATLLVVGGEVPADSKAAQMRSFDVEVMDPTGALIPEDLDSILAPGWMILVEKGTKIENFVVHETLCNDTASWNRCELVSLVIDSNGHVILGS